jgi:short-subunit dehydrogenase
VSSDIERPTFQGRRYWIVGASHGLGLAIARELDARGAELVLSARSEDRLAAVAEEMRAARALPVDLADPGSVAAAAEDLGDIDGMVFSAGQYEPLRAVDWDAEAVEKMCGGNFRGAMRALGVVVPRFVARDRGHIVLIGSLAGFRGLPGSTGYGASKAGVMNAAESLHADLRATGVRVQLVNPGFIRTRLTEKNDFRMPQIMSPEDAAGHVVRAMESGRFYTSFPRPFSWLFLASRFMPGWLFHRVVG